MSEAIDFYLKSGDKLPKFSAILKQDGEPVDLTGATGASLNFRRIGATSGVTQAATIVDPEIGAVEYQWQDDDLEIGDYQADWTVTYVVGVVHFPNDGYIFFRVLPAAIDGEEDSTPLASFREPVRLLLGDSDPLVTQYSAAQIDAAVRFVVNRGRAEGVTVSSDQQHIEPAVSPSGESQRTNWARIVLYSAKVFAVVDAAGGSFRTRALAESFGERRDAVFSLLNEIYEVEFGHGGE
ncbi:MAG TPA: BppU family phage baseplate upper protein [Verrucomicrobiae bacterium]|nr:BppU family phage baseplate upper protein [Verrucomicrobiae bacterium]